MLQSLFDCNSIHKLPRVLPAPYAEKGIVKMSKEKILIIYEDFSAGGSTTSLLALLNAWDYDRYGVDLLPYRLGAEERARLESRIPPQVNILNDAVKLGNSPKNRPLKGALMITSPHFHKAIKARKNGANKYVVLQHMGYAKVRLCRRIPEIYRAAIAFIEGWSTSYLLSDKVKADKKIAFVHLDYKTAGVDPEIDRKPFEKLNSLIAVSDSCRKGLIELYPEYSDKITAIENLHQTELIKKLSKQAPPEGFPDRVNFLTVCRPDIKVKGLDRLLDAAVNLRKSGYKFTWAVVGAGGYEQFLQMLKERDLQDCVLPFNVTENPYPCFIRADWFVLTSRTEAKPMTVTESMILGTPCIVTDYASATEQIENGINGIITENSTDGIITALKQVLDAKELRKAFTDSLQSRSYDNTEELQKLYGII